MNKVSKRRGRIICDILVNYNALANVMQPLDSIRNLMQYIFLQTIGFMLAVGATNLSFTVFLKENVVFALEWG